jgi:phytoene dehydrogenase-like protein
LQTFAYVHLAPSLDQMARTYAQARAGLLPDEPILVVGQPTVFDPSRAPKGKHVLWVQVRMAPGTILGDAKGEIAATDWAKAAEPFAQRALQILERYAPGTGAKILASRVVTPNDLESDNPNLVGGDQVCGSHHLAQNFLFRPARGHADGSTPLKQLHLTGAANKKDKKRNSTNRKHHETLTTFPSANLSRHGRGGGLWPARPRPSD